MALNNSMNAPATQYNLIVGTGAGYSAIAPSSTSGIALVSAGDSANPQYSTVVVAGGGTGAVTFTEFAVICAGTTATGAFQNVSGVGSIGQVLTSAGAGALPAWATPTIADLPWTVVTGATQAISVDNGYVANAASGGIDFSLPATAAVGSIVRIAGVASGSGWTITQGSGQQIEFGSAATTAGAGGSIASTNANDCLEMLCVVANDSWVVLSAVGNLDVV